MRNNSLVHSYESVYSTSIQFSFTSEQTRLSHHPTLLVPTRKQALMFCYIFGIQMIRLKIMSFGEEKTNRYCKNQFKFWNFGSFPKLFKLFKLSSKLRLEDFIAFGDLHRRWWWLLTMNWFAAISSYQLRQYGNLFNRSDAYHLLIVFYWFHTTEEDVYGYISAGSDYIAQPYHSALKVSIFFAPRVSPAAFCRSAFHFIAATHVLFIAAIKREIIRLCLQPNLKAWLLFGDKVEPSEYNLPKLSSWVDTKFGFGSNIACLFYW